MKKAISTIRSDISLGPSSIVVEMIRAEGDTGDMILLFVIARSQLTGDKKFTVCLYKANGDALEKGNYRGLKLAKEAIQIPERSVDGLISGVY